jgi:pentapeptide MXKDX repeat protein
MKKNILPIVIVAFVLVSLLGGALAFSNNRTDKKNAEVAAMEKEKSETAAMEKEKMEKEAMEKDAMVKEDSVMEKDDAMSASGSYVTLADYSANEAKYADSKKVYFFHASWCPICRSIDEEITGDTSKIPAKVTIIKTDFDSATELRKKFGVSTQYTFVEVDAAGNEVSQWSATTLQKALDGISS